MRVSWRVLAVLPNASERHSFLKDSRMELREEEFRSLMGESLPVDLVERLRRLDSEIHTLAHRIEESLMERRRHPADRVIDI